MKSLFLELLPLFCAAQTTPAIEPTWSHDPFSISGLLVGQAEDPSGQTGCTVLVFPDGATVGVDVRGSAPGSRELALLEPGNLVDKVHAIVLSGGSAFGLATADGVMRQLEERGIGYPTGEAVVPIVVGGVLYDLGFGSPTVRPDAALGYRAAQLAQDSIFQSGNYGAGAGAMVGKVMGTANATKGGIGCATLTFPSGLSISAIVAVNALGDIYEGDNIIAGARDSTSSGWVVATDFLMQGYRPNVFPGSNTTLGVIVTNAKLDRSRARKLAQTTHDAFARRIRPVHTSFDGDLIFAASTGSVEAPDQLFLTVAANRVMERAILRAVREARTSFGVPAAIDIGKE